MEGEDLGENDFLKDSSEDIGSSDENDQIRFRY